MTAMKQRAIDMISRMPKEKLKDICQIIKVEGIDSFKIISVSASKDGVVHFSSIPAILIDII